MGGYDGRRSVRSDLMAEVNARIRELGAAYRTGPAAAEEWEFVCECGTTGCGLRVPLSLLDYDALRAEGGRVVAPGHGNGAAAGPSTRAWPTGATSG
jgi:hypothetical protein